MLSPGFHGHTEPAPGLDRASYPVPSAVWQKDDRIDCANPKDQCLLSTTVNFRDFPSEHI